MKPKILANLLCIAVLSLLIGLYFQALLDSTVASWLLYAMPL